MQWPLQKAPAPGISRVLYVNMDRDARRRAWMEGQLRRLRGNITEEAQLSGFVSNFTTERISAVDTLQAKTDSQFSSIRMRGFNPTSYPNVLGMWSVAGCTFSHLTILRKLQLQSVELLARNEVWLILEDDAIVGPAIGAAWQELWRWLPEDWDLVRLGWFGGNTCRARVNDHVDLAMWSDPPPAGPCSYCGSHAYIVNPASVERVLQRLERSRIMHVDCLLGATTPPLEDPRQLPPLLSFAVRPIASEQNEHFPTDRVD